MRKKEKSCSWAPRGGRKAAFWPIGTSTLNPGKGEENGKLCSFSPSLTGRSGKRERGGKLFLRGKKRGEGNDGKTPS